MDVNSTEEIVVSEKIPSSTKNNKDDALFTIDNTKQIIMMDIFWYIFFVLFIFMLFILVLYSDQSVGKTSEEIFLQEIYNPRFASVLVILLIIGPVATFLSIRKHLKQDNHLYFFDNRIEYQDRVVELSEVESIKIGFYPLKGGLREKILMYVFGFWFVLPLFLFNILWFYILKLLLLNSSMNNLNRFLIVIKNEKKSFLGAIYSAEEMANLKKFPRSQRPRWECI